MDFKQGIQTILSWTAPVWLLLTIQLKSSLTVDELLGNALNHKCIHCAIKINGYSYQTTNFILAQCLIIQKRTLYRLVF